MLVVGRSPSGRLEGDINLSFLADVKSQICSRLGDTLPSVLCIEYNKGKERERALLRTFPAFSSPSSIMPPFPSPLRTLPRLASRSVPASSARWFSPAFRRAAYVVAGGAGVVSVGSFFQGKLDAVSL
jgi:hypothetical protein